MLKNDMRNAIIAGESFEEFVEVYGERYRNSFSMETMEKCWKNTHELVEPYKWHNYLLKCASNYVRFLELVSEGLNDQGVSLLDTEPGYRLSLLVGRQKCFE